MPDTQLNPHSPQHPVCYSWYLTRAPSHGCLLESYKKRKRKKKGKRGNYVEEKEVYKSLSGHEYSHVCCHDDHLWTITSGRPYWTTTFGRPPLDDYPRTTTSGRPHWTTTSGRLPLDDPFLKTHLYDDHLWTTHFPVWARPSGSEQLQHDSLKDVFCLPLLPSLLTELWDSYSWVPLYILALVAQVLVLVFDYSYEYHSMYS